MDIVVENTTLIHIKLDNYFDFLVSMKYFGNHGWDK